MEKQGYREQLDRLVARFPGRETINIHEAAEVVGLSQRILMSDKTFPARKPGHAANAKIIVSISALARWLA